jgi:hypothetical protein
MTGAIDMAAMCLVNEGNIYASELSEAYKAAVTAALPSGVEPLDVFWRARRGGRRLHHLPTKPRTPAIAGGGD